MNFEFFIASRIVKRESKGTISAPIIKIAIVAIALGLVMMLVAIATGLGLKHEVQQKISALNGHIQIMNYDANRSQVTINPIEKKQNFYPNWQLFFNKKFQKEKKLFFENSLQITHIQPVIAKAGIIRTEKTFEGIIAKGVDASFEWAPMKSFLIAGRLPNFSKEVSNEILISDYLANRLSLKVGDSCNTLFLKEDEPDALPNQRNFLIVGIFNSGFHQFDATYILTDMRQLQKMNKWTENQVGMFEVYINQFEKMGQANAFIYENISSELDSQSIAQKYQVIFDWFETFNLNIIIIIAVMILVAGVNIITAILVLILERTPMIGMLKALGASNWSIRKVFLYNAGYLIAQGLFWGNVIGILLLSIQKYFAPLKLNPSIYYVSQVPVMLHFGYIFLLNVGVFLLCLLMLVLPSYIISKISPIKSIKFD